MRGRATALASRKEVRVMIVATAICVATAAAAILYVAAWLFPARPDDS
jgi:hypothetical protein